METTTTRIPLADYLDRPGMTQSKLGALVGLKQASISEMLTSGRQVFVIEMPDGPHLYEIKALGGRVPAKA